MPIESEIPFAVVPLTIIAGLFSLFYSLYGAFATFFMIGDTTPHSWGDIYGGVLMSLPLLAFPIFLSSLYSMKTCRNWFTAYFIVDFLLGSIIIFKGFRLGLFFTIFRIAVILAVVLLNAAYLLVRHALRGSNEKIPGFINIMNR
jgi:hypothetical protein